MTTNKQPNEVEREPVAGKQSQQHNAISKQKMSALLARKRHMSGMMCPPVGHLSGMLEQASKSD